MMSGGFRIGPKNYDPGQLEKMSPEQLARALKTADAGKNTDGSSSSYAAAGKKLTAPTGRMSLSQMRYADNAKNVIAASKQHDAVVDVIEQLFRNSETLAVGCRALTGILKEAME